MLQKCRSHFTKEYYRRLTFNLLLFSATIPVVGHVVKFAFLRYCGYLMVTFSLYLEMHTRLYGSVQLLRNSPSFQIVETAWEMIVGNNLVLNRQVPQVLLFLESKRTATQLLTLPQLSAGFVLKNLLFVISCYLTCRWTIAVAILQCVPILGWLFYKKNIDGCLLLPFKVVLGLLKAALGKSRLSNNPKTQ